MNLDDSADSGRGAHGLPGRDSAAVRPDPVSSVLNSIRGFANARKAREQELLSFQRFRNAVQNAGYSEARDYIADQVGLGLTQMYRMNRPPEEYNEDYEGEEEIYYDEEYNDQQTQPGARVPSPRQPGRISPRNPSGIRPNGTNSSLSDKEAVGLLGMSIARLSQRGKGKAADGVHPRDAWKQFLNTNPEALKHNPSLNTVENASNLYTSQGSPRTKQLGKSAPSYLRPGDKLEGKLPGDKDGPIQDSPLSKSKVLGHPDIVKKCVPFFANMVENRVKFHLKQWGFGVAKERFVTLPKKLKQLEKVGKVVDKSGKQAFFSQMETLMEQESVLSEKLREFYRLNLKRIFFNTLKGFGAFQRTWVVQVRHSILKGIVFETIKRNHVEEKVARKVEAYHVSRLLRAWHRVAQVEALEADKVVEGFQGHKHSKVATKVLRELRSNALAGKQERRRDLDSILQYQRVRIYRIFEFWKTQASKRKKPVDFSRYQGLNSIPMRITQKKTVELLDDDLTKVLKSKPISTTFKLLHPSTKTT